MLVMQFCLDLSNDNVLASAVRLRVGTAGNEESKIAVGKSVGHMVIALFASRSSLFHGMPLMIEH